ncbi:MAG: PqqD family protein [Sphingomonadales bacterium]|nr:PqqD family protein [Sphingomonadales bacterium]|tara:strand:+ start:311 stop:589 length:279 start_codon:yes stop_codon:yes gene_type:complete
MNLDMDSKVFHDEAVIFTDIEDKIVMLNVENGAYYDFDSIASHIWRKLEKPISVAQLCADLCEEFEVDADSFRADSLAFLDDLMARNLIIAC